MAGKEVGHLFLHTLLWWTKEYGDERGRNPATSLIVNPLSGVRTAKVWDSPPAGTVPILLVIFQPDDQNGGT